MIITIRRSFILLTSVLFYGMSVYACYVPQVIADKEESLGNVYLKALDRPVFIKGELACLSRWIKEHVSQKVGLDSKSPLSVLIDRETIKQIRDCMGAIIEDNHEQLQYEILGDLGIRELANLIIYSWYLKIDRLLLIAGKEFVELLSSEQLDNFTVQGDFFDSIMNAEGKSDQVDWHLVIANLKKWLATLVLTAEDQNQIRSQLICRLPCSGMPVACDISNMGHYLALGGRHEGVGFCDVWSTQNEEKVRTFSEVGPVQNMTFCKAPYLGIATAKKFILGDLVTNELVLIEDLNSPTQTMAVSKDLKKAAFAVDECILVSDLETKKSLLLKSEEHGVGSTAKFLSFVPNSHLLIDIRDKDGVIRFWNVVTGKCLALSALHGGDINTYHCSDEGILSTMSNNGVLVQLDCTLDQTGAMTSLDEPLNCWDPRGKKEKFTLWSEDCYPLCFNTLGTKIVIGNKEGGGLIFNIDKERSIFSDFEAAEEVFCDGCYGRDELLATVTKEHSIILWDAGKGTRLAHFDLREPVRFLRFSPNNEYLLCSTNDSAVLWYYSNKEVVRYLSSGLELEQQLLLLVWLRNNYQLPNREHLLERLKSLNPNLIGRFLKHK